MRVGMAATNYDGLKYAKSCKCSSNKGIIIIVVVVADLEHYTMMWIYRTVYIYIYILGTTAVSDTFSDALMNDIWAVNCRNTRKTNTTVWVLIINNEQHDDTIERLIYT